MFVKGSEDGEIPLYVQRSMVKKKRKIALPMEKLEKQRLGIGLNLLEKLGWAGGPIGKAAKGITHPVVLKGNEGLAGLGFVPPLPDARPAGEKKKSSGPVRHECERCGEICVGKKALKDHLKEHAKEKRKKKKRGGDDEENDGGDQEKEEKEEKEDRPVVTKLKRPFSAPRRQ